jgi:lysophospholipase L1-like esterase
MDAGQPRSTKADLERTVAGAFLFIALAISPAGVRIAAGRTELSFRIAFISSCLALFLAAIAGGMLTRGRLRGLFFWCIIGLLPVAALCALEAIAQAVHLSDRVMPLNNLSVLKNRNHYPGYFLSDMSSVTFEKDGLLLYLPWQDANITINSLGLRTAMPSPKAEGEWRVAITGGSTAWGWWVLDQDTIAVQLENILRKRKVANVKVFNFGISGRELRHELALLKSFRDTYAIDQAIFYTGGNDVSYSYSKQFEAQGAANQLATWELVKTAQRTRIMLVGQSAEEIAHLDNEIIPRLQRNNSVKTGMAAAFEYCSHAGLACDVVLQPMLATRRGAVGKELEMKNALLSIYPRIDAAADKMFSDAIAVAPRDRVHDFTALFDGRSENFYADAIHVSEAGNRLIAERLADTIKIGPQ